MMSYLIPIVHVILGLEIGVISGLRVLLLHSLRGICGSRILDKVVHHFTKEETPLDRNAGQRQYNDTIDDQSDDDNSSLLICQ